MNISETVRRRVKTMKMWTPQAIIISPRQYSGIYWIWPGSAVSAVEIDDITKISQKIFVGAPPNLAAAYPWG